MTKDRGLLEISYWNIKITEYNFLLSIVLKCFFVLNYYRITKIAYVGSKRVVCSSDRC